MIRSTKDFWAGLIYVFLRKLRDCHCARLCHGHGDAHGARLFSESAWRSACADRRSSRLFVLFLPQGKPIGGFALKGLSLVIASVVLFGFIVRGAGLAGRSATVRRDQCARQLAFPLGPDAGDGGRTDDLLRVRVYQRLGHSSAADRSVVRRLS